LFGVYSPVDGVFAAITGAIEARMRSAGETATRTFRLSILRSDGPNSRQQKENEMTTSVHGIHHVTCIAGSAQENLDFYVRLMGMRLVKKSVNQDDPGTYHLFYADRVGTPGTDFTFFPWPDMGPGRLGIGLTVEV